MDFDLSPEQQQLSDAISRWAGKDYSFEKRKEIIHSEIGWSEPAWQALAELGVLALPVPADCEGFDGTPIDQMVVMRFGNFLIARPAIAEIVAFQNAGVLEQLDGAIDSGDGNMGVDRRRAPIQFLGVGMIAAAYLYWTGLSILRVFWLAPIGAFAYLMTLK